MVASIYLLAAASFHSFPCLWVFLSLPHSLFVFAFCLFSVLGVLSQSYKDTYDGVDLGPSRLIQNKLPHVKNHNLFPPTKLFAFKNSIHRFQGLVFDSSGYQITQFSEGNTEKSRDLRWGDTGSEQHHSNAWLIFTPLFSCKHKDLQL